MNNKALVVGMGKTGLSITRFLCSRAAFSSINVADIYAADTRDCPPMMAQINAAIGESNCYVGENLATWSSSRLQQFRYIFAGPGMLLPPHWPVIIPELELFNAAAQSSALPVLLLVTGTNGKSTVAALLVELCRAADIHAEAVGNFGEPLLDAVMRWHSSSPPAVAIVELSSFQLLHCDGVVAHAATVLNITPDHLDYHRDFGEYVTAKSHIYAKADYGVFNLDAPFVKTVPIKRRTTFSTTQKADWYLAGEYIVGDGISLRRDAMSAALSPENVCAALALFFTLQQRGGDGKAALLTAPLSAAVLDKLTGVLADFVGLSHRRQWVGNFGGVCYINDSKSTNVSSACFALKRTPGNIILIAGGDGKGQDFSPLAAACQKLKKVFLLGKDAAIVRAALVGGGVDSEIVADMKSAVRAATKTARCGDTILLSPACSSLDYYENYAARGDDFIAEAQQYAS